VDTEFQTIIEEVIASIAAAGFEPYDQLYGYVTTGREEYITRRDNAREKIRNIDPVQLREFVKHMTPSHL